MSDLPHSVAETTDIASKDTHLASDAEITNTAPKDTHLASVAETTKTASKDSTQGDFMKAVQKKLLELFNPTSGQTFAVQFPGRFLQKDLYAWNADTAGIYGQFSKPVVVNESEFRLVDQLYDVGQVVGAPNGSNLSIIYEEILNNLVPGFDSSQPTWQSNRTRFVSGF